jgi:hypothetical protein
MSSNPKKVEFPPAYNEYIPEAPEDERVEAQTEAIVTKLEEIKKSQSENTDSIIILLLFILVPTATILTGVFGILLTFIAMIIYLGRKQARSRRLP